MNLELQRRLASQILKCSPKRVVFDSERLEEIDESITKADIRSLIIDKAISKKPKEGSSRARARKIHRQKRKGKRSGHGSRKGTAKAREDKKEKWMNHIRKQRAFLKNLRDDGKVDTSVYRNLYLKAKGGFFRSIRHIKIYLEEHDLMKDGN